MVPVINNEVDTEPKVVTEILCLALWGIRVRVWVMVWVWVRVWVRVGVRVGLELIILGTLSLYYYAHSITPC